ALIPGKKAPVLITEDAVKQMKKGSVIVDLAAEAGGNCVLTEPGKRAVKHGVQIIGELNIPSLLAQESSLLYARNIFNMMSEMYKDGKPAINENDEVIQGSLIVKAGELVHPALKEKLQQARP
ncbi:MAG: NAD(P)(+) transhydrogenase (AB-specific), partial [Parcubacteria group bacterium GW2011_GWA2_43_17]